MGKRILLLVFTIGFVTYCTNLNDNPTGSIQGPVEPGSITLSMDMSTAPQNVAEVKGFLARAATDTIFFTFEMHGQKAVAQVNDITPGIWYLQVDAYDARHTILYSGHTSVTVEAGQIIPVYLQLNPVTGGLIIFVSWGNDNIARHILAYFPFDSTAEDFSSFHNHAQIFGNITYAKGVKDLALNFDGKTAYVQIPDLDIYQRNEYTIAFWFCKTDSSIPDTPGYDDVQGLVFKAFNTSKFRDFSFLIGRQNPPFRLVFNIFDSGDSLIFLRAYEAIYPKQWYHVAGVVENHRAYLYLNGELVSETTFTGHQYHSNAPIILGAVPPTDKMIYRYFKGKIDEFVLFDTALSRETIQKIIQRGIRF